MKKTKSPQKLILTSLVLVGVLVANLSKTYGTEVSNQNQSSHQTMTEVNEVQNETEFHEDGLILEPQASVGQLQVVSPDEIWENESSQVLFLMIVALTVINVVALAASNYERMLKSQKEMKSISCES